MKQKSHPDALKFVVVFPSWLLNYCRIPPAPSPCKLVCLEGAPTLQPFMKQLFISPPLIVGIKGAGSGSAWWNPKILEWFGLGGI